jgi:hypothetical protein
MSRDPKAIGLRLRRCLAVVALIGIYFFSILGIVVMTGTTAVQARGRGGRGGGRGIGRGFVRGRGRGVGVYYGGYYDGCWWSPRYRRWVCPYY